MAFDTGVLEPTLALPAVVVVVITLVGAVLRMRQKRTQHTTPIERISSAAFNGAHCEEGSRITTSQADATLLANTDTYIGYMTLECQPGIVYFARLGASIFSPATGKPSAGCAVSVLVDDTATMQTGKQMSLSPPTSSPALASRRTQYAIPGSDHFLPHYSLFSSHGKTGTGECVEGGVGSCWLVAAMASVAPHQGVVAHLFKRATSNASYAITLHSQDATQPTVTVTVDEALPACCSVSTKSFRAAYTKPATASGMDPATPLVIWPCLLEKACAASGLYADGGKGYEGLNGGDPGRALQTLTGAEPTVCKISDMGPSGLDLMLQGYITTGQHAICLASAIFDARAQCDVVSRGGVQQNHAYSVLASRPLLTRRVAASSGGADIPQVESPRVSDPSIHHDEAAPMHEFQLRNPWGRLGLAQPGKPLHDAASDGKFWMSAEAMMRLFDVAYVVSLTAGGS